MYKYVVTSIKKRQNDSEWGNTIWAKRLACSFEWPKVSICQAIFGRPHSPKVSSKNLSLNNVLVQFLNNFTRGLKQLILIFNVDFESGIEHSSVIFIYFDRSLLLLIFNLNYFSLTEKSQLISADPHLISTDSHLTSADSHLQHVRNNFLRWDQLYSQLI